MVNLIELELYAMKLSAANDVCVLDQEYDGMK